MTFVKTYTICKMIVVETGRLLKDHRVTDENLQRRDSYKCFL